MWSDSKYLLLGLHHHHPHPTSALKPLTSSSSSLFTDGVPTWLPHLHLKWNMFWSFRGAQYESVLIDHKQPAGGQVDWKITQPVTSQSFRSPRPQVDQLHRHLTIWFYLLFRVTQLFSMFSALASIKWPVESGQSGRRWRIRCHSVAISSPIRVFRGQWTVNKFFRSDPPLGPSVAILY